MSWDAAMITSSLIGSDQFYAIRKPNPCARVQNGETMRSFSRQECAFEFFDSLTYFQRRNCKLLSYESESSGKRLFLVANFHSFCHEYFTVMKEKLFRHAYEIIREGFPCRAYFDLEFSIPNNRDVDGDALTASWINLVAWKLYEQFGFSVGPQHVMVLDSTTPEKYSKHVTLILQDVHGSGAQPDGDKEYLFSSNAAVGELVQSVLLDITSPLPYSITGDATRAVEVGGQRRAPKESHAHLWVASGGSDGQSVGRKTCFVDLGVYTRNRAFRLFGSCKRGKTQQMHLHMRDAQRYTAAAATLAAGNKDKLLDLARTRRELLRLSLVVPADLFNGPLPSDDPTTAPSPRDATRSRRSHGTAVERPDYWASFNADRYVLLGSAGGRSGDGAATARRMYSLSAPGGGEHTAGAGSAGRTQESLRRRPNEVARSRHCPSWFPEVDEYVAEHYAQEGGVRGALGSWTLTCATQAATSGVNGNACSAAGDGINDGPCTFVFYKLRYQVLYNRWCRNVGRAHRSNGVVLEVDLSRREVAQTCWDADCRGFRSAPEPLPGGLGVPDPRALHATITDRCLEAALRENPGLWGGGGDA